MHNIQDYIVEDPELIKDGNIEGSADGENDLIWLNKITQTTQPDMEIGIGQNFWINCKWC